MIEHIEELTRAYLDRHTGNPSNIAASIDLTYYKSMMNPHALHHPTNHEAELPIFMSFIIAPDLWPRDDVYELMRRNQYQLEVAIARCIAAGYTCTDAIDHIEDTFVRSHLTWKARNEGGLYETFVDKRMAGYPGRVDESAADSLGPLDNWGFFGGALPSR